jgi:hypothetical protein
MQCFVAILQKTTVLRRFFGVAIDHANYAGMFGDRPVLNFSADGITSYTNSAICEQKRDPRGFKSNRPLIPKERLGRFQSSSGFSIESGAFKMEIGQSER